MHEDPDALLSGFHVDTYEHNLSMFERDETIEDDDETEDDEELGGES